MTLPQISFEQGEANIDWLGLIAALAAAHDLPKAEVADSFLYRGQDTLLNRCAWIDGLGMAVKTANIFPGNPAAGKAMVNGAVTLYSDADGCAEAMVDFHLVTKWKTAGDSLLAATRLARKDSKNILILGAGTVGHSLFHAYRAAFPAAQFSIWNRTTAKAHAMAAELGIEAVEDLEAAVRRADIITSATMSTDPILRGEWLQPGQHIDLIGAYRPDMREADDGALQKARIFVDNFGTTLGHIGEVQIPLDQGVIRREDILADFYDLDQFTRRSDSEITLFKNGGGAHLDLMVSRYILDQWRAAQG